MHSIQGIFQQQNWMHHPIISRRDSQSQGCHVYDGRQWAMWQWWSDELMIESWLIDCNCNNAIMMWGDTHRHREAHAQTHRANNNNNNRQAQTNGSARSQWKFKDQEWDLENKSHLERTCPVSKIGRGETVVREGSQSNRCCLPPRFFLLFKSSPGHQPTTNQPAFCSLQQLPPLDMSNYLIVHLSLPES